METEGEDILMKTIPLTRSATKKERSLYHFMYSYFAAHENFFKNYMINTGRTSPGGNYLTVCDKGGGGAVLILTCGKK